MNSRFKVFAIMACVGLLSASSVRAELKVGDAAPDLAIKGSDGKTYKLSDFEGKQAVVIAWFPKAFTGGCTKECISMRESGEKLRQFNVAYFTASTDDVATNARFAESLELDYPILSDPEKKAAEAFGVINPQRQLPQRWTYYIGKNGKILHVDKQVNTSAHGADIAAKLKELGVEEKR